MKKLLSLLLTMLLCFAAFGCSSSGTVGSSTDTTATDLSPAAARAYTLTLERERLLMPTIDALNLQLQ